MAETPEGKVKKAVKKALLAHGVVPFSDVISGAATSYEGFYYMPVAGPFAVHGVHDFVGCWRGVFFSLETKAPDNRVDATIHQESFRQAVSTTGGLAYVGVRSAAAVDDLRSKVLAYAQVNQSKTGIPESV